ncbi:peptidoglycan-recognition protein LC-like isoform X5 [Drosophila innubila]|uniref:peptidoglycan-recognition protein LC-like isoform X5 n=1 Tax=Drosophila innubila TaxID=198719 RepID=UPI00148C2DE2|nr:peptidoglycan-recognition protein LC-like isoform X5 [Drosophila innubila]
MHVNSETEFNANNIHIINRTSGKNCSTSSTDSGVGLVDNTATYITKNSSRKGSEETKQTYDDGEKQQKAETETDTQRISIEVEAKVNLNKKVRKTSPALSIRSTTISIVSIDEDAIDSSCIDSDSEAEPDEGCTVHKLGQQLKYPPPQSDELTQLNKGLTVISRQVLPSNGQGPPVPDAPDIVAQQLLNGSMNLATPTAPATPQQIGSIALTNTTDVTFGDKHYYEGPVTIQQILIDSREKWKAAEGQDNPAFDPQATPNATGTKSNESCEAPALCPFLPHNISRKAIIITAIFVALTIVLGIILATTTNLFGKTLNKMSLQVISVQNWGGRQPKGNLTKLDLPVHRVIISHTAAEGCESEDVCAARVRVIQGFHMDGWNWDHIGYNFLIGGDGLVYEGRGWDDQGAHTRGYNVDSIGISFIGTFIQIWPTEYQLRACQLLLEEGVRLKKLVPNYKLYGHRQLSATESPGELLYGIIQKWPHWTNKTF